MFIVGYCGLLIIQMENRITNLINNVVKNNINNEKTFFLMEYVYKTMLSLIKDIFILSVNGLLPNRNITWKMGDYSLNKFILNMWTDIEIRITDDKYNKWLQFTWI